MTAKSLILFAAAVIFAASSTLVSAKNAKAPGQMMQENGSVKGEPGASGYAPGHLMQKNGSVKGTTGASGYAPGRATTGASTETDVDVKAKSGRGVDVDVDSKTKIK
jgi:hypothetical protein